MDRDDKLKALRNLPADEMTELLEDFDDNVEAAEEIHDKASMMALQRILIEKEICTAEELGEKLEASTLLVRDIVLASFRSDEDVEAARLRAAAYIVNGEVEDTEEF